MDIEKLSDDIHYAVEDVIDRYHLTDEDKRAFLRLMDEENRSSIETFFNKPTKTCLECGESYNFFYENCPYCEEKFYMIGDDGHE